MKNEMIARKIELINNGSGDKRMKPEKFMGIINASGVTDTKRMREIIEELEINTKEYEETKKTFIKYWDSGKIYIPLYTMQQQIKITETPVQLRPTQEDIDKHGWHLAWQIAWGEIAWCDDDNNND